MALENCVGQRKSLVFHSWQTERENLGENGSARSTGTNTASSAWEGESVTVTGNTANARGLS